MVLSVSLVGTATSSRGFPFGESLSGGLQTAFCGQRLVLDGSRSWGELLRGSVLVCFVSHLLKPVIMYVMHANACGCIDHFT